MKVFSPWPWLPVATMVSVLSGGSPGIASAADPAQPVKPAATLKPAPPKTTPAAAARATPPPQAESGLQRLKSLVQAAEKALETEDFETASTKAEEAEVLLADWSADVLQRPDIAEQIARLQAVQRQTEVEEVTDESPIKDLDDGGPLTPEQLKAEREQVMRAAGEGAVYDFPIDLNDKVLLWVNVFTGRIKSKIEASLSRASSYLPMIRQVFAEEGLPQDLAFLPLIESGYINKVKSCASAVGMWQFMASTGRLFGLTQNAWVDERRDPVKSTRAAARYLKQLYQSSGDWYLALAGYNNGPGRVESAAQTIGSRNFWDIARSRHMRDATKAYVPQFCAGVLVGRFPEKYGLKITQNPPYVFETVELEHSTSLVSIAKYANLNLEDLKQLNPSLVRSVTPPGRYTLRVPPGQGPSTARALAKIPMMERLEFKHYKIRRGDTLTRVASRFGVAPEELLQANDMSRAQFRAGRTIQIPPPLPEPNPEEVCPRETNDNAKQVVAGSRPPLAPLPAIPGLDASPHPDCPTPTPNMKETAPPTPRPRSHPKPASKPTVHVFFHRVKPGETLFSIAMRYGVDVQDIRKWNKLRRSSIFTGQKLKIQR